MPELTIADFERFFVALWGKSPFAWQLALAKRVLENPTAPWPEVIGLPTGSGKTACIDIAMFALAASATTGQRLPRRIFFTVDRRIIVDEAFSRARALAQKLQSAPDGILKQVADRLRQLAGAQTPDVVPLSAHVLRGGMYRDEGWAKSPAMPSVVCTTVDQLGSRLLFRAYGRSFKAWPIHAGLVGNDSLILLDEAHCAQPLLQSLTAIRRYRGWAKTPLDNPLFISVMSATPPAGSSDVFRDDSDQPRDANHPLGRRQLAPKLATLAESIKGTKQASDDKLVKELVRQARALVDDDHRAIVVFCNRVATARAVYKTLSTGKGRVGTTTLLTGRMRPIDKDAVATNTLTMLASDRSEQRQLTEPMFVVATQTLEVGADLDFDALVTECASLDALRQRFGRLNRMGRPFEARAAVVIRESDAKDSSDDPVYGAAMGNTWRWLESIADDQRKVNFGISALAARLPNSTLQEELSVPAPRTPIMLPAHIDGWAQTAPQPEPTADIALFLHGVNRGSADVQLCWRGDITIGDADDIERARATLTLAPPTTPECLAVPIGTMRRWLAGELTDDTSSDLEGEAAPDGDDTENESPRRVLRWRNRNDITVIDDPRKLRPGDICVAPANWRDGHVLGDIPASDVATDGDARLDIGDQAALQAHGKARLRLHPALIECWPDNDAVTALLAWLPTAPEAFEEDAHATRRELRHLLGAVATAMHEPGTRDWLRRTCASLANDRRTRLEPHPDGGFILHGTKRVSLAPADLDFGDEDDASASGTVDVTLPVHLAGVGEFAERFAKACGLPDALIDALRRAGRLHDLGKADPRFQTLLRGGNPWALGPLLAKSGTVPKSRQAFLAARKSSGYPQGGRHELLSVRLAESAPDLLPDDPLLRDLVLHLVASHHGYCRPFAPVIFDDAPNNVAVEFDQRRMMASSETQLERLDSGISERYWRLTRHFGWWGLAWLEAILRLADHRRSEWEQTQEGDNP